MEAGLLAQGCHKIKAKGASAHSEAEVSRQRPPCQRVHRRRRHFPGRAFAALGFRARSRSARSLPRPPNRESLSVYVFLAIRRAEKFGRNARARLLSRNAGARQRTKARIPSHCRNPPPWTRRSRRRGPGTENARRRKRTRRARDAGRSRPQRPRPRQRIRFGKSSI